MASNKKAEVSTKPQQQSKSDGEKPVIEIISTHSSHAREFPAKPTKAILKVISDILSRADESIRGKSESAVASAGKTSWEGYAGILKEYASTINKISCELSCKCEAYSSESTTSAILNHLSDYFWDARVVIALAAFAIIYGDFCLVTKLSATNPLAMSVSLLKQPDITVQRANSLLDTIKKLLEAIRGVTETICDCQDIFQTSNEEVAISEAADWAIRSMVACSSQINIRLGTSGKSTTSTTEELSSLEDRLTKMQNTLNSKIDQDKRYQGFSDTLKKPNADIIEIITPLIPSLLDGSTDDKRAVGIKEVLKGKTVVLLISGLDIVEKDLSELKRCHHEKKTGSVLHYEIVWIPVVDSSDEASQGKFQTKMKELKMPWYIVADPWSLDPVLIRYMKEVWNFSKKLILVVVDSQGKMVCKNALNMFRVWGNHAYPFTTATENLLKEVTWSADLLVDQSTLKLRSKETFICLYGGSNADWIGNFVSEAIKVAKTADIELEMFYAGKSKTDERVKNINTDIEAGKIRGRLLPNQTDFWTRLENLLKSRVQIDGKTAKDDRILREVMVMLSFGKSDQGWAVFCKGSTDMVSAHGDTIMKILKNLSAEGIKEKGLVLALSESIGLLRKKGHSHCNRITIPLFIEEEWQCGDCGRPMEMRIEYRCCTD